MGVVGAADVPLDVKDVFAVLGGRIDADGPGETEWSGWLPITSDAVPADEAEVR